MKRPAIWPAFFIFTTMKQIAATCLLLCSTLLSAQGIHIEPPNWWTDMPGHSVELLIHGQHDIASVTVQGQGVKVMTDSPANNPHYRYVTLSISPEAEPQDLILAIDYAGRHRSKKVNYELKARDPLINANMGLSARDQLYLVTPDRFVNGDTQNDVVRGMKERAVNRQDDYSRHGGDLSGLASQLDYIQSLGTTAVWPMPILENNMHGQSYHGYAITDHYAVDPRFGGLESYQLLADQLHQRGMKLVMDMVLNHTGSMHHLFQDPPDSNWFNAWPLSSNKGDEQTLSLRSSHKYQGIYDPYASKDDVRRFTDGWFVPSMTDLNGRDAHCAQWLIQNSLWWIETVGVDAFRVDTYFYPDQAFMRQWTAAIHAVYPEFFVFSESWTHDAHSQAYFLNSQPALDAGADFLIYHALKSVMEEPASWTTGPTKLYAALAADYLYPEQAKDMVIFLDNHDEGRFMGKIDGNMKMYKVGLGLLYALRGMPCLYYGTEIGYDAVNDHGAMRQDMLGGFPGDQGSAFRGEGLTETQQEALAYVRQLGALRHQETLIGTGKLMQWAPDGGAYALAWYDDKEVLIVIINVDETDRQWDMSRFSELGIDQGQSARSLLDEKVMTIESSQHLPAQSIRWLKITKD